MDSLIFELQIVLYFQLFLSANVRHTTTKTMPALTDIKAELSQEVASVRKFCDSGTLAQPSTTG